VQGPATENEPEPVQERLVPVLCIVIIGEWRSPFYGPILDGFVKNVGMQVDQVLDPLEAPLCSSRLSASWHRLLDPV